MNRIAILLLLLASFAIADNAGDKTGFLHRVNRIRREFAKKYNVPDMNELIWSQDLVHIVEKLDWNETIWPEARKKWRWGALFHYDDVSKEIDDQLKVFNNKNETEKDEAVYSRHALELLVATQTVIGCGSNKDSGYIICLLGPEVNYVRFDKTLTASAKCSKHYTYKNGLCSPDDPHKVSYFGFRDDFIPELNEIRRQYALDYQIPNMHAMVWNKTLVEIGGFKKWEERKWPDARNTWRWDRLESYRDLAKEVAEARDWFSKQSEDEKKTWVSRNQHGSLGTMELFNPTQTSIGCVPKWEGADVFLLCLIGNGGAHNTPGSECMKGYHNVDGLCTPSSSTSSKRRARSI